MKRKIKSAVSVIIIIAVFCLITYIDIFGLTIGAFHLPSALDKEKGIRMGLDIVGGSVITYEAVLDGEMDSQTLLSNMNTVVSMLQQRVTQKGYTEATVTLQGDRRVRVELPSITDTETAVKELGTTASLTFCDLEGNILVDGSDVKDAIYRYQPLVNNGPSESFVEIVFNDTGAANFASATEKLSDLATTGQNVMTIKLDDEIVQIAQVNEKIEGGSAVITGNFNAEDARYLADIIRSGQLPFKLQNVEVRTVGPTLGEQALSTSIYAGGIGVLLLIVFILIFYRGMGIAADIAILFYVSLVVFILSAFRVNLSLPGIAGIILSIGMAVDANIIIYERIKEEMKLGKSAGYSIDLGFKKAISAIFDGNVTTLIAAVVLFYLGTGTIKGFAVTLIIGMLTGMFTALFITKILLNSMIGLGIKNPKFYSGSGVSCK